MYDLIQYSTQDRFILFFSLSLLFIAAVVFIYHLMPDPKAAIALKRLGMEDSSKKSKILILRFLKPLFPPLISLIVRFKLSEHKELLKRKLITANLSSELTPDEFIAFKVCTTFLVPLAASLLTTAFGYNLSAIFIMGFFVLGFYYPDIWINQRIKVRKIEILMHLPYTIDILTLSVEAGLDFISALSRLVEKTKPNALLDEFTQMLKEIRLGTSRADALKNLAERLNIEEISSLVTLLIQVDQFGADVGSVLRAQSDHIRANRFFAAEQAGAKASQLILFPMILLIFPAIFIVILGPYYIMYKSGGLF